MDNTMKLASEKAFSNRSMLDDISYNFGFEDGAEWAAEREKWISVIDRMPTVEDTDYFVCVRNKNKEGGIFLYDIANYSDGKFHKKNTWEQVTHWKLPTPPKTSK